MFSEKLRNQGVTYFSSACKHMSKAKKENDNVEYECPFSLCSNETNKDANNVTASFLGMITNHATHNRKRNNEEMNRHCIYPHNDNNFGDNSSLSQEVWTMELNIKEAI